MITFSFKSQALSVKSIFPNLQLTIRLKTPFRMGLTPPCWLTSSRQASYNFENIMKIKKTDLSKFPCVVFKYADKIDSFHKHSIISNSQNIDIPSYLYRKSNNLIYLNPTKRNTFGIESRHNKNAKTRERGVSDFHVYLYNEDNLYQRIINNNTHIILLS